MLHGGRGSIPVSAGVSGPVSRLPSAGPGGSPRVREGVSIRGSQSPSAGLSPRVRGRFERRAAWLGDDGSIPARAGLRRRLQPVAGMMVDPRAGGVLVSGHPRLCAVSMQCL